MEGRRGQKLVAAHLVGVHGYEGGDRRAGALRRIDALEPHRQPAAVVGHGGRRATRLESLHGTGQREVIARALFRLQRIEALQTAAQVDQPVRLLHGVGNAAPAVGGGQVEPVRHRAAPLADAVAVSACRGGVERLQAAADAEQATDVAGVAVGVPTAGVGDHQRMGEVAAAGQQGQDDDRVIRDHVAVATVLVVAVAALDAPEALAPVVAVRRVPLTEVADQARDHRVGGNETHRGVQQGVDVRLRERRRLHRRQHLGAVHRLAVMAHAARLGGQRGGQLRVARRHHGPAVDEDLGADLLCHHLGVEGDGTAARRLDAVLEAQVGGVLGGVAQAAPPQHGALLDQVVEPGAPDVGRAEVGAASEVFQRANEGERARDVVVGDDQRHAEALVHIVGDLTELALDARELPALERAPQVDADDLSQHARVDAFRIVLW